MVWTQILILRLSDIDDQVSDLTTQNWPGLNIYELILDWHMDIDDLDSTITDLSLDLDINILD